MSPRSCNIIQHPLITIPRHFIVIPRYFIVIPAKAGITGNIMNNAISRRSFHHIAPAPIHCNHANKRRAT